MVRNLIRNQAPGNRLRVRIPCPPLCHLGSGPTWQRESGVERVESRLSGPIRFCGVYSPLSVFYFLRCLPMQLGAWRLPRCISRCAPKSSRFSRRESRQNTAVLHDPR